MASVCHCIGEWTLQKYLGGDAVKFGAEFEVPGYIGEDHVKVSYSCGKVAQYRRAVDTAKEKSTGIAQYAVHVTDEFVRRSNLRRGAEVCVLERSIAYSFLSSVGEGSKKVLEKSSLFIHTSVPFL